MITVKTLVCIACFCRASLRIFLIMLPFSAGWFGYVFAEEYEAEALSDEGSFGGGGEEIFFGDYEQRMFQIYKSYHNMPTPDSDWRDMLGRQESDEHTVQTGDTLWDISKVLFDDPNYWPKIWSVNPFIDNPHRISPGQILRFIYGTSITPPSMRLSEEDVYDRNRKKDREEAIKAVRERQFIEAEMEKSVPVLRQFPSGLVPITLFKEQEEKQEDLVYAFGSLARKNKHVLTYFMADDPDFEKGTVLRKIDRGAWGSSEHYVLIEMDSPVSAGQKFSVLNNVGRVPILRRGISGPYGHQIQVQGEVQVMGEVDPQDGIYQARIIRTFSPITKKAMVSSHPIGIYTIENTGNRGSGREAQIIGTPPKARNRKWGSLLSVVYLNRGTKDGYRKGEIYEVKMNKDSRPFFDYGYPLNAGQVKIIDVNERFSTAIIIDMYYPIRVGDLIIPVGTGVLKKYNIDGETDGELSFNRGGKEDEAPEDFFDEDFDEEEREPLMEEDEARPPSQNEGDIAQELRDSEAFEEEDGDVFIDDDEAFTTDEEEWVDDGELSLEDFEEVPNDADEFEAEFEGDFE